MKAATIEFPRRRLSHTLLPAAIPHLIAERRLICRVWQSSHDSALKREYNFWTTRIRDEIRATKNEFWSRLIDDCNGESLPQMEPYREFTNKFKYSFAIHGEHRLIYTAQHNVDAIVDCLEL